MLRQFLPTSFAKSLGVAAVIMGKTPRPESGQATVGEMRIWIDLLLFGPGPAKICEVRPLISAIYRGGWASEQKMNTVSTVSDHTAWSRHPRRRKNR